MDSHDSEEHPRESGLEHLSTEELLERLREVNQQPPQPGKQTLEEYLIEEIEKEDRRNLGGQDPECNQRE